MGVPKAFVEAFDKLSPRTKITNGHVKGPPIQVRRSAVHLSERFANPEFTARSTSSNNEHTNSAAHASTSSGTSQLTAQPTTATRRPAFDVDETGRAKAMPVDIALIRKKTALRITWRVPMRASRDGRQVLPHVARTVDNTTNEIGSSATAGQQTNFDVVVRTEVRTISAELLRVEAPSTDVKGAGVLVYGKRGIVITELVVVGNYALRIAFSDGHDAGIFPYGFLYELSTEKWPVSRAYLQRMADHRKSRIPPRPIAPKQLGCGAQRAPSAATNAFAPEKAMPNEPSTT